MSKFTFINLIGNNDFLDFLGDKIPEDIKNKIVDSWKPSNSTATDGMMSNIRQIAKGGFNTVYDLGFIFKNIVLRKTNKIVNINESPVIEEKTIHFDNIDENGIGELKGLFIQWFLSQKCEKINKVIEFGIYIDNKPDNNDNKPQVFVYALLEKFSTDLFKYTFKNNNNYSNNIESYNNIFKDIAKGLKCMHDLNYYHLDIKPENIGLKLNDDKKTYSAIICDFGFATYISNTSCISERKGTPFYYDPYLYNHKTICKKVDEYSFGMMIYQICTFNDSLSTEITNKIINLIEPYKIEDLKNIKTTLEVIRNDDEEIKKTEEIFTKIEKSRIDDSMASKIFNSFTALSKPSKNNTENNEKDENSKYLEKTKTR